MKASPLSSAVVATAEASPTIIATPSSYHSLELGQTEAVDLPEPIKHQSKAMFLLVAFVLCTAYWLLSGGLTLFNKWFFSLHGFPFPILFIMCTLVVHSFITQVVVRLIMSERNRQKVTLSVFYTYLLPIAFCSALEISSSNLAIVKLSVSFHTMVHASKPVFFAIWSVILGLESASWQIASIVGLVTLGVVLLSLGESLSETHNSSFDLWSFWMILFSCFISGLRWNVAQLMLQRVSINSNTNQKLSPMNLLYYTSPFSALSLLPFFLIFELARFQLYVQQQTDLSGDLLGFGVLVSVWALVMTLVEFYLVRQTSAVLFSFAAILKEIMVITVALLVNGDSLPALNILGFICCILGIIAYQRYKFSKYDEIKPSG